MIEFIKKHWTVILSAAFGLLFTLLCYGCEPKVKSLDSDIRLVNRAEFKIELERLLSLAELRLAELDQQEQIRGLIFNNAVSLAQGEQINPLGILTAIAGIYGLAAASKNSTSAIASAIRKTRESHVDKA